jgi:hypothetical protein
MIPVTKENVLVFLNSINAYTHYGDAYYGQKVCDLIVASAQHAKIQAIGDVIAKLMDREACVPFLAATTKDKDHAMKIAVTIDVLAKMIYGVGTVSQKTTADVLDGLQEQLIEMHTIERAAFADARKHYQH